jgi:hypothetical protein
MEDQALAFQGLGLGLDRDQLRRKSGAQTGACFVLINLTSSGNDASGGADGDATGDTGRSCAARNRSRSPDSSGADSRNRRDSRTLRRSAGSEPGERSAAGSRRGDSRHSEMRDSRHSHHRGTPERRENHRREIHHRGNRRHHHGSHRLRRGNRRRHDRHHRRDRSEPGPSIHRSRLSLMAPCPDWQAKAPRRAVVGWLRERRWPQPQGPDGGQGRVRDWMSSSMNLPNRRRCLAPHSGGWPRRVDVRSLPS